MNVSNTQNITTNINIYNNIKTEKKRKSNGNRVIKRSERQEKKSKNIKYLAQGTLYTDVIESKRGRGRKKAKRN